MPRVYRYVAAADDYDSIHRTGSAKEDALFRRIMRATSIVRWPQVQFTEFFRKGCLGDFVSYSYAAPIVSTRAWNILEPLIADEVQPLDVILPEGTFHMLNVLDVVDALDVESSWVNRNSDGTIRSVSRYKLIPERVCGKHMFRLPETKGYEVLVSDEFRRVVESNELMGLDFSQVLLR